jgi:hypothetical protein
LSLGVTGPLVGLIVAGLGYSPIFLFAALMAACALGLTMALNRRTVGEQSVVFASAD